MNRRNRVPELMDDPGLDPAEHRLALQGLARINRLTRSAGLLWPTIRDLAREIGRPLRILDVATGSGDVPAGLLALAARAGTPVEAAGCDISPTAIAFAQANHPGIRFFQHDVIRDRLPPGFDVVTCSLFLHHLADEDAVVLLGRMKDAAGRLVMVNDLARSRFNYFSVALSCRLLTRSRVVRYDGPASVRAAFTPEEALELAGRAGLAGATVRRRFPCRFLLQCRVSGRSGIGYDGDRV